MSVAVPAEADRIKFIPHLGRRYTEQSQCLVDRVGLPQGSEDNFAAGPDDRELTTTTAEILGCNVANVAAVRHLSGPGQ